MWLCYIFGHKWKWSEKKVNMYTLGAFMHCDYAQVNVTCNRCGAKGVSTWDGENITVKEDGQSD